MISPFCIKLERVFSCRTLLLAALAVLGQIRAHAQGVIFYDVAGNPLAARGIALVDWDGYIANPAVQLTLAPAPDIVHFPATVKLSASEPRMYFNSPSTIGPDGPAKTVTFANASSRVVAYFSIFPDRAGNDLDQLLQYKVTETGGAIHSGNVSVHVFDQDLNQPSAFRATTGFTYDAAGFFTDPVRRQIVQQAADDWAYFIDDMSLDAVAAGAEKIWIYPPITDFSVATLNPNPAAYTGFLMEMYGVQDPDIRAGGAGSNQSFQTSHGVPLSIRRSGNVAMDTRGNFNTLGWMLITNDADWWMTDNRGEHQPDLYSIAHHEMGHAFGFNVSYPLEVIAKNRGDFESAALLAYHGKYPKVDITDHLAGEIDDASLRAGFGNEYNASMPEGRWLITKLDLLCLETVGYKIRHTFDLALLTSTLPAGSKHNRYASTMRAKGGLPWYSWSVASGALPDGLTLDSSNGVIYGEPTRAGNFTFTIRVTDSSGQAASVVSAPYNLSVSTPADTQNYLGVAFQPYVGAWSGTAPTAGYPSFNSYAQTQVQALLQTIQPSFDHIATYGAGYGSNYSNATAWNAVDSNWMVGPSAANINSSMGRKVLDVAQGIYQQLDSPGSNGFNLPLMNAEINGALSIAQNANAIFPQTVTRLIFTNEFVTDATSATNLTSLIRQYATQAHELGLAVGVRSQVFGQLTNPGGAYYNELVTLVQNCDFIMCNLYPGQAESATAAVTDVAAQFAAIRNAAQAVNPAIEVMIGETGWSSQGASFNNTDSSTVNAQTYFAAIGEWANANQVLTYYFEAVDEPWKDDQNATGNASPGGPNGAEAHFGLWSFNGTSLAPKLVIPILPLDFNDWLASLALTGAKALAGARPFSDALANLPRYAMNLAPNPVAGQAPGTSIVTIDGVNYVELQFRRRKVLSNVQTTVQSSADLVNWSDVPSTAITQMADDDANTERFAARVAFSAGGLVFLRILVSQP